MDRLVERFSGGFRLPSWPQMLKAGPQAYDEGYFAFSTPAVDVTEDEKAYKITAEVPGLQEKNIDITVSANTLIFKGEKRYEKDEEGENRYVSERGYGSFQRSFTLPDSVDRDKIGAELSKGVLTVILPKTAEAQKQQKKIAVKAAG